MSDAGIYAQWFDELGNSIQEELKELSPMTIIIGGAVFLLLLATWAVMFIIEFVKMHFM